MVAAMKVMSAKLYGDRYIFTQYDDPDQYEYGFMQVMSASERFRKWGRGAHRPLFRWCLPFVPTYRSLKCFDLSSSSVFVFKKDAP